MTHLFQAIILLSGALAIWLTQDKRPAWQRWACIVGMAGEPFWLLESWRSGQWGILILTIIYSIAWARGIWNFWLMPVLRR